jgi:dienelactone hydrolase
MTSEAFESLKELAQNFVGLLLKADFTSATLNFDDQMKAALTESKLQESWQDLILDAGNLLQLHIESTMEMENYRIVIIRCQFQRHNIDVKVIFNENKQISGLNFTSTNFEYHPPDYINESAFDELDVTIGKGKWAIPGVLTLPTDTGPFPGLILVHGSGPNDRDETIGPNKTFRDLAWGLASKNIAVLRYDKRTFTHAKKFTPEILDKLTVKEEVIDDALLAIQLMLQRKEVNSKRIFLLGHSLGATVAPRIAQRTQNLAGIIIMAGITRSLEDTILEQYTYLYNLDDKITAQQNDELKSLKSKVEKVKNLEISDNVSPQDLPLGVPVAYWKDLLENNQVKIAESLKIPILILQGGRDYQVLESKDFKGWKNALNNHDNVQFELFPKLNHLFIEGEGKSTPKEYMNEGHVNSEVIKTIINWIKNV